MPVRTTSPFASTDFHAAMSAEVIAERRSRPAAAAIERVADDAAPARIGRIDPDVEARFLDVIVEIEVTDTRLDAARTHCARSLRSRDSDRLRSSTTLPEYTGARAAVREVAAGGNRIERNAMLIGGAHHRLHFFERRRRDRGRSDALFRLAIERRVGVAIQRDVRLLGEDPFFTRRPRATLSQAASKAV